MRCMEILLSIYATRLLTPATSSAQHWRNFDATNLAVRLAAQSDVTRCFSSLITKAHGKLVALIQGSSRYSRMRNDRAIFRRRPQARSRTQLVAVLLPHTSPLFSRSDSDMASSRGSRISPPDVSTPRSACSQVGLFRRAPSPPHRHTSFSIFPRQILLRAEGLRMPVLQMTTRRMIGLESG